MGPEERGKQHLYTVTIQTWIPDGHNSWAAQAAELEHESTAIESNSSRAPSLLNIPPEIRNRIYEFALTDCKALQVTSRGGSPKAFHLGLVEARPSGAGHADGSAEPQDGPTHGTEFNQLKYVCRQLRCETAGLELAYNHIVFRASANASRAYGNPAEEFLAFYRSIAPRWSRTMGKVYLTHGGDQEQMAYQVRRYITIDVGCTGGEKSTLDAICADNPQMTVFMGTRGFSAAMGPDLILVGMLLHNGLRGGEIEGMYNPFPAWYLPGWDAECIKLRRAIWNAKCAPANVRFLPRGKFDQERWTKGMLRLKQRFYTLPDLHETYEKNGGASHWLPYAKRWYEEGV